VAMCLTYIALSYLRKEKRNFLLILRYAAIHDASAAALLEPLRHKLKNKTVSGGEVELTVEVNVKKNQTAFMEPFTAAGYIDSAVLVEYNGDYT